VSNVEKVVGVEERSTLVSNSDGWHSHQWGNKIAIISRLNDISRIWFLTCICFSTKRERRQSELNDQMGYTPHPFAFDRGTSPRTEVGLYLEL